MGESIFERLSVLKNVKCEIKKRKKEIICGIILIILWVIEFSIIPKINVIKKLSGISNVADVDITSIVLGAVATFAGLLIPLHYALSLDIIGKIKESGQINCKQKNALLYYCHTSDIVIFVTALFGASTLIEGAISLSNKYINISFCQWSRMIGYIFIIFTLIALIISLLVGSSHWKVKCEGKNFNWYLIFVLAIGTLSILWAWGLMNINNGNGIALLSLFILSLFYFLWLMLRMVYIPMTQVVELSLS